LHFFGVQYIQHRNLLGMIVDCSPMNPYLYLKEINTCASHHSFAAEMTVIPRNLLFGHIQGSIMQNGSVLTVSVRVPHAGE